MFITEADLISFMDKTEMKITELEKERNKVSNRIRRPKSEEDLIENKELRKQISEKIKPLRQELNLANKIFSSLPRVRELIELERQHEIATLEKTRERNYER